MNNRIKYLFIILFLAVISVQTSSSAFAQTPTTEPSPTSVPAPTSSVTSSSNIESSSDGFFHRNPNVANGISSFFSFLFGTGNPANTNIGGQIKAVVDAVSPFKSYLEFFTNNGNKTVKGLTIAPDGSIVAGGWSNPDAPLSTDPPNSGYPKPVGGPNDSTRNFKIYDFYLDMMSTHSQSPAKFYVRSIINREFYDPPDLAFDRVSPDAAVMPQIDAAGQQGIKYPYGPWGITPAGTTLGIIYWRGSFKDTAGHAGIAARSALIYARNEQDLVSETSVPGTLNFATAGQTGGPVDRMVIKSSGNVGIGTILPAQKLETSGTIRASRTGTPTQFLDLAANNGSGLLRTSSAMPLELGEGSNSHLTISGNGNIGVGTTQPAQKFETSGTMRTSRAGTPTQYVDLTTNGTSGLLRTSSGMPLELGVGANSQMVVDANGNVGINTTQPATPLETVGKFRVSRTGTPSQYIDFVANGGPGLIRTASGMPLELGIGSSSNMVINTNGNVGIGTSQTTNARLNVTIEDPTNWAGIIRNVQSSGGPKGLLVLTRQNQGTAAKFEVGTGVDETSYTSAFKIDNVGNVGIGTSAPTAKLEVNGSLKTASCTGCADIAENYKSDEALEAGEIVSISPKKGYIVKSTKAYDRKVMGIISSTPAIRISENGGVTVSKGDGSKNSDGYPVALTGRVPLKVSTENGPIEPGDYLTASSTPGVAMKATKTGQVIAKSLEYFDGTQGKITAFVINTWYTPEE